MPYLVGELAALGAAFLWAIASMVWYRVGKQIPPLELNFIKVNVAIVLIVITFCFQGIANVNLQPIPIALLLASGAIGIGLADTAFFTALNDLGVRLTLLLKTLTSPLVALLALVFLKEQLSVFAALGMFLTIFGVAWVVSERVPENQAAPINLLSGISWTIVSTIGDAAAVILSRVALSQTDITPLWSTLWRLLAGAMVMLPYLWIKNWAFSEPKYFGFNLVKKALSPKLAGAIAITAFASTYLGIWLQQISLKEAPAGIAQTLCATSPLFAIPIAMGMGEVVSKRAILGAMIALLGVGLLFDLF